MEIEKEIIKLSSCQTYLIVQSFKTLINLIHIESNKQKQINFREAQISCIDVFNDQLLIGTNEGKVYLQNDTSYTIYRVHSSKIIDMSINDGILLSLGSDGLLVQTNLRTLTQLYERQLSPQISNGKIEIIQQQILIQYDLKVILLNLENDTITQKYQINSQAPLILKLNNLSKNYFSILGQDGVMNVYNINENNAIQTIDIKQQFQYQLYYLNNKITILKYDQTALTCYTYKNNQLNQEYQSEYHNLYQILQLPQYLLIVFDNISNPKLLKIKNIEEHKFKKVYLKEQLGQANSISKVVTIQSYYDQQYLVDKQYKQQLQEIQNSEVIPNDASLSNVLNQALIVKDLNIIEYALNKTPQNLIGSSVNTLQLDRLQELLNYLVDKLINFPQNIQYNEWIKEIIRKGVGDFKKLYYYLEERTANSHKIKDLYTKATLYNMMKTNTKQIKDYRIQPHNIYKEIDEDVKVIEQQVDQQIQDLMDTDKMNEEEDEFDQVYRFHKKQLKTDLQMEKEDENGPDIEF